MKWITEAGVAGNSWGQILSFFAIFLGAMAVGRIARMLMVSSASRMDGRNRPLGAVVMRSLAGSVMPLAAALGLNFAMKALSFTHDRINNLFQTITSVLLVMAMAWVAYRLTDVIYHWIKRGADRTKSKMDDMLAPLVRTSLRVTVAVLAGLQIATLLSDKPLTSILAGLGVLSIGISLASQDTVKNLFGSLMILADKPFEIGDRIVVDGHDGPVEEVGFRSTRIRTLEGHVVTVPNGELANKTILNIGKRPHIRRLMNVALTYDTPPEKVKRAVEILKALLKDHEGMAPDFPPRVYFSDMKDWSLNILVLYWYHPADYWAFMDFSERINQELLEHFTAEGIDFAFPTQTVQLETAKTS